MRRVALRAAGALAAALAMGPRQPVRAHSWYPHECCSDGDCHLAQALERGGPGGLVAIVHGLRITVPRDMPPRPSPDGEAHVCYEDGDLGIKVRCVFLPAEG